MNDLGIRQVEWDGCEGHEIAPAVFDPGGSQLYIRPNGDETAPDGYWWVCHGPTQRTLAAFCPIQNAVLFMDSIRHLINWSKVNSESEIPRGIRAMVLELVTECGGTRGKVSR